MAKRTGSALSCRRYRFSLSFRGACQPLIGPILTWYGYGAVEPAHADRWRSVAQSMIAHCTSDRCWSPERILTISFGFLSSTSESSESLPAWAAGAGACDGVCESTDPRACVVNGQQRLRTPRALSPPLHGNQEGGHHQVHPPPPHPTPRYHPGESHASCAAHPAAAPAAASVAAAPAPACDCDCTDACDAVDPRGVPRSVWVPDRRCSHP
jgi:hypothetical protein